MTWFPKNESSATSPSRRADPLFAAKDQRVSSAAARAARIDRLLGGSDPDVRIPHRAEVFLRVCAADGVMIWSGAARFDEGAGAFFALKPEDEARFFAALAARFQEGCRTPPPALDWDDDGSDNGLAATTKGWDAETEKRHQRLEVVRSIAQGEARKEGAARQAILRDGAEDAPPQDEGRAPQDEGKARWFGPAGDDLPAEHLAQGETALELSRTILSKIAGLHCDVIAMRDELRGVARSRAWVLPERIEDPGPDLKQTLGGIAVALLAFAIIFILIKTGVAP